MRCQSGARGWRTCQSHAGIRSNGDRLSTIVEVRENDSGGSCPLGENRGFGYSWSWNGKRDAEENAKREELSVHVDGLSWKVCLEA